VAVAGDAVVLSGSRSRVRALGLAPSAPVTLESSPAGSGTWTPAATGTASAAGTATLPSTVSGTTDYRVVSGAAASAPITVVGAFPPQRPANVVATPGGHGRVTVTWQPPADTGGVPLTQFAIRVDGKRVVVPASARSAVVTGVRAGSREAMVRAVNQVAMSWWARTPVPVPAYPSVSGPTRVRRGTTVTLHLAGLLPGHPTTLRVTTVASGKVVTRVVHPRSDGTASVRLLVRRTVRVVAVSGGVTSPAHRIKVH
jgi:hypothetical protein